MNSSVGKHAAGSNGVRSVVSRRLGVRTSTYGAHAAPRFTPSLWPSGPAAWSPQSRVLAIFSVFALLLGGYTAVTSSAAATPRSIWSAGEAPRSGADPEVAKVELGTRFTTSVPGTVQAIRYYNFTASIGPSTGTLWDARGRKLASVSFSPGSADGWRRAPSPSRSPCRRVGPTWSPTALVAGTRVTRSTSPRVESVDRVRSPRLPVCTATGQGSPGTRGAARPTTPTSSSWPAGGRARRRRPPRRPPSRRRAPRRRARRRRSPTPSSTPTPTRTTPSATPTPTRRRPRRPRPRPRRRNRPCLRPPEGRTVRPNRAGAGTPTRRRPGPAGTLKRVPQDASSGGLALRHPRLDRDRRRRCDLLRVLRHGLDRRHREQRDHLQRQQPHGRRDAGRSPCGTLRA